MSRDPAAIPGVPIARGGDGVASGWVAGVAAACSVHCLMTPVLATVAPFMVLAEGAEWWMWGGTAFLAVVMLAIRPGRHRPAIAGLVLAGTAIWAASLAGWFEPAPEIVTSPVGSLLIAGGLLWSARLCRAKAC